MRESWHLRVRLSVVPLLVLACSATTAGAQPSPGPTSVTLESALQYAVDHYPSVAAAIEQVNASSAEVRVARSAYLPRLDAVWQSNRATANNVFGQ